MHPFSFIPFIALLVAVAFTAISAVLGTHRRAGGSMTEVFALSVRLGVRGSDGPARTGSDSCTVLAETRPSASPAAECLRDSAHDAARTASRGESPPTRENRLRNGTRLWAGCDGCSRRRPWRNGNRMGRMDAAIRNDVDGPDSNGMHSDGDCRLSSLPAFASVGNDLHREYRAASLSCCFRGSDDFSSRRLLY